MHRSDYVWEGGGMMRMPCWECGDNFSARRDDAKYCGPNCRKKANRRKTRVQEAAQIAVEQLKFLQETQRLRPDLAGDVRIALNVIKWQLDVTAGTSHKEVQLFV